MVAFAKIKVFPHLPEVFKEIIKQDMDPLGVFWTPRIKEASENPMITKTTQELQWKWKILK